MFPLKKIMCPVDFSEHSFKALKIAREMAEKFSAELYIPHIILPVPLVPTPPHPVSFDVATYRENLKENSQKTLQKIIEEKTSDSIQTFAIVEQGDPAHEIMKIVKEKKIDLIVISTHGHSGLHHLIFGSVAEKIIRHTSCPVLTIRIR